MDGRDPGLQPERTVLAWRRTGLTAAIAGVLLLRGGLASDRWLYLVAAVCLSVTLVLVAVASWAPSRRGASQRMLLWTAVTVVAAGIVSVVALASPSV